MSILICRESDAPSNPAGNDVVVYAANYANLLIILPQNSSSLFGKVPFTAWQKALTLAFLSDISRT